MVKFAMQEVHAVYQDEIEDVAKDNMNDSLSIANSHLLIDLSDRSVDTWASK